MMIYAMGVPTVTFEERAFRLEHPARMTNKDIAMATVTPIATLAPWLIPTVEVLLLDEVLWPDVCEGANAVDDGEFTSRHEASAESSTFNRADVPLCPPCESVMKNMRLVPSLTFTTQV